jgi:hypothetical protein
MDDSQEFLEQTWDGLLSRHPHRIRRTFQSLDPASQQVVLEHLKKMVSEEGWHPEQRLSAQSALDSIKDLL